MRKLKAHPAAEIFPLLAVTELKSLSDDIKTNGQRDPIVIHPDGSILDGRNRHAACVMADVDPIIRQWDGEPGTELAFVLSCNLHRRHLNESQRAMVAARVATLTKGANQHAQICAPSQDDAAQMLNVSRDGKRFWVEIKTFHHAEPNRTHGCLVHGIKGRHYHDYLRVEKESGCRVYLAVIEIVTGDLLWLRLGASPVPREKFGPFNCQCGACKSGGQCFAPIREGIYFNRDAFKTIHTFAGSEIGQMRSAFELSRDKNQQGSQPCF